MARSKRTASASVKQAARKPRSTSKSVASLASDVLRDPEAGEREKTLAATALSQAADQPEAVPLTPENIEAARVHADLVQQTALSVLRDLVDAARGLINESQGVYGLHKNGDFAPWPELLRGGRCEGWLSALNEAEDFLGGLS